jgi:hypothetical protein
MTHDRSNLPPDFTLGHAWGSAGDPDYEALAERYRPIFARIRENSIARELALQL